MFRNSLNNCSLNLLLSAFPALNTGATEQKPLPSWRWTWSRGGAGEGVIQTLNKLWSVIPSSGFQTQWASESFGGLLKCRLLGPTSSFWFSRSGGEKAQGSALLSSFPGDGDAAGLESHLENRPQIRAQGVVVGELRFTTGWPWKPHAVTFEARIWQGNEKEYSRQREQPTQKSWGKSRRSKEASLTGVERGKEERGTRGRQGHKDPDLGRPGGPPWGFLTSLWDREALEGFE